MYLTNEKPVFYFSFSILCLCLENLFFISSALRYPLCSHFPFPFLFSFFESIFSSFLLAGHTQAIETFVTESMEALSTRPESMEEIGAASAKYNQILARKPDVRHKHS